MIDTNLMQLHSKLGRGASDAFRLLSVVGAYEYAGGGNKFCDEHFVRPKVSGSDCVWNAANLKSGYGRDP